MATTKTKPQTVKLSKDIILTHYMEYVLEHEQYPKSVYQFTKANGYSESEFYAFFGNLDGVKSFVWEAFYNNTLNVLTKDKAFKDYNTKEKLLAFYYTFFETLTLNRSYVLFSLQSSVKSLSNLRDLATLRSKTKQFATMYLVPEAKENSCEKRQKFNSKSIAEGVWLQLLFLLKFWSNDSSAKLEKTDIAIEKSVTAVMDLFHYSPLESLIDFGKFLWHERKI